MYLVWLLLFHLARTALINPSEDEQVIRILETYTSAKNDMAVYDLVQRLSSQGESYVDEALALAAQNDRVLLFESLSMFTTEFPLELLEDALINYSKDSRTIKAVSSLYFKFVPEGILFNESGVRLSKAIHDHPMGGLDRMWKFACRFKHPTGYSMLVFEWLLENDQKQDATKFFQLAGLKNTIKRFKPDLDTLEGRGNQRGTMFKAIQDNKGSDVRRQLVHTDPIMMPLFVRDAIKNKSYRALTMLLSQYPIKEWSITTLLAVFNNYPSRAKEILFRGLYPKTDLINWINLSMIPFDRDMFKLLIDTPGYVPNNMDILISLPRILNPPPTTWHYSIKFIDRFKNVFDTQSRIMVTSWFIKQRLMMEIVRFWEGLEEKLELEEINHVLVKAGPILVEFHKMDAGHQTQAESVLEKLQQLVNDRQTVTSPSS